MCAGDDLLRIDRNLVCDAECLGACDEALIHPGDLSCLCHELYPLLVEAYRILSGIGEILLKILAYHVGILDETSVTLGDKRRDRRDAGC